MSSDQTNSSAPELAKLQARSNLLLALYTHVAHDLEQTQRERDRLRTDVIGTQNELAQERNALSDTKIELDQVRSQLAGTHGELSGARSELAGARDELAGVRAELAHALSELQRFNTDLHLTRVALGQSAARATELEQRHAALLGSTSWRVSAPIRAFGRLLKRAP